jgi:hypothetical protein
MKQRSTKFNNKRRLAPLEDWPEMRLASLCKSVRYGGNPEHKKKPGDFNLTPPSCARRGKSLCDSIGIFTRRNALKLLRLGVSRGLVSKQMQNDWPQNIWTVYKGRVLEAQLEQAENGTYHGYPLQDEDPFADAILARWRTKP